METSALDATNVKKAFNVLLIEIYNQIKIFLMIMVFIIINMELI